MIDFNELNILQKYCDNQVNKDKFKELMMPKYNNEDYIDDKWISFKNNPIQFITSRRETELLDNILLYIKTTKYNG